MEAMVRLPTFRGSGCMAAFRAVARALSRPSSSRPDAVRFHFRNDGVLCTAAATRSSGSGGPHSSH